MRIAPSCVVVLLLGALSSGCFGSDSTGSEDPASDAPTASGPAASSSAPDNGTTQPTGSPARENQAPTVNLTASVQEGAAPLNVSFNVTGEDPDGDGLTWTLDVDGDGAADHNGTTLPTVIDATYEAAGNFTATLTVSDGNLSATANLTIAVIAGGRLPLILVDPAGDGTHDFLDFVAASMSDDETTLTILVTFKSLQPNAGTYSVMNFEVNLNGVAHTVTNCLGLGWDMFDGTSFLGPDVTVDNSKQTIKVEVGLEKITKTTLPYKVFFRTAVSPDQCGDLNQFFDRMPNTGDSVYG